jgi:hypothetical protein
MVKSERTDGLATCSIIAAVYAVPKEYADRQDNYCAKSHIDKTWKGLVIHIQNQNQDPQTPEMYEPRKLAICGFWDPMGCSAETACD